MAHLLVTGGAGYVGSHALRALRRAGHTTVVLDDLRAGHEFLAQGETLARVDVGDALGVEGVFAEHGPFHGVLHFAAYLVVPETPAFLNTNRLRSHTSPTSAIAPNRYPPKTSLGQWTPKYTLEAPTAKINRPTPTWTDRRIPIGTTDFSTK